jgi:RNA polymerase-binding transcription factor DksA
MDKDLQKKLEKKLEAEKKRLTKDLKFFARKDPRRKGNWLTHLPFFGNDRSHKDESAEKIEEYGKLLPLEHTLELRLKDVEDALGKIKKDAYGQCENCQEDIQLKRLEVIPEARLCLECCQAKTAR